MTSDSVVGGCVGGSGERITHVHVRAPKSSLPSVLQAASSSPGTRHLAYTQISKIHIYVLPRHKRGAL